MKRFRLLLLSALAGLCANPAQAQDLSPPGLGNSTAAPVGKPFALPEGVTLRQPIKPYDASRPQDCGNRDAKKAYGTDGHLIALCLQFTNRTGAPIDVTLPPGLIFRSRNVRKQNGIVVQSQVIQVPPAAIFYAPLRLYCANGNRPGPGDDDLYDLGPITEAPQLIALFRKLAGKNLAGVDVIQGFVWDTAATGEISAFVDMMDTLPAPASR
ncbi:hypothetical protein FHS95_001325 [Sphingomonas naasensis]|uniref:DUF4352 domain-containing protein n=1 Tax=Sphingomonas naasensis TaxID=1344951 RepID=A0A4S1W4S0_9SPHN|nr:hypothetical protein [Sphingomonas naasensis]NIJ19656.1 hypothetical protein [Sphingomonas naasensis]TGX37273.1 hypothetical protein E5A74_20210 [Sphingomonas naasensis]